MRRPLADITRRANAAGPFTGGPKKSFEAVGRHTFMTLLRQGMLPDSIVLDYGCGVMRLGYWIMRFLDTGHYFAIEPNSKHLSIGKEVIIGEDLIQAKQPKFSESGDFDLSVFGDVRFNYIVARSVFTHFTPAAIRKVLLHLPNVLAPGGMMLASFWPPLPEGTAIEGNSVLVGEDLLEREPTAGIDVTYVPETLIGFARDAGLQASVLRQPVLGRQPWMKFTLSRS